jgi:spermidine synthase
LALAPAALTSGLSEIALEVVIIIAFQTFYGYVYFSLGLIVSAFMVGLMVGTAVARRTADQIRRPWRGLVVIQLLYATLSLLIIAVLYFFSYYEPAGLVGGLDLFFSFLNMLCGILCGFHFVTASRALLQSGYSPESSGGLVYGTNLLGASIGALTASVVIIPVFGLVATVLLVCAANLCAATATGIGSMRMRRKA